MKLLNYLLCARIRRTEEKKMEMKMKNFNVTPLRIRK